MSTTGFWEWCTTRLTALSDDCSDEDLDQIKGFLTRFKTQPGKQRDNFGNGMIDEDDDEIDTVAPGEAPRQKYLDIMVRRLSLFGNKRVLISLTRHVHYSKGSQTGIKNG